MPPKYSGFPEKVSENLMIATIINVLDTVRELKCETVAFPVFKEYPLEGVAYSLINFCAKWAASQNPGTLKTVRLVNHDEKKV